MVGFNREVDYAIRIMHCLSKENGNRIYAGEIAKRTGVTLRFSLKILGRLVQNGLVHSIKGVGGGYILARPRASITVLDTIKAVLGNINISPCCDPTYDCGRPEEDACVYHELFCDINNRVIKQLGEVNFAMTAGDKD